MNIFLVGGPAHYTVYEVEDWMTVLEVPLRSHVDPERRPGREMEKAGTRRARYRRCPCERCFDFYYEGTFDGSHQEEGGVTTTPASCMLPTKL
jgi:hypothetical protein